MAVITSDICCALRRLNASNDDTEINIRNSIRTTINNFKEGGFTTIFCNVLEHEKELEKNLRKIGFTNAFSFKRRRVYDNTNIKMMKLDMETYVQRTERKAAKTVITKKK